MAKNKFKNIIAKEKKIGEDKSLYIKKGILLPQLIGHNKETKRGILLAQVVEV